MRTPVGLSTASCPLGKAENTFRLAAELGYDGVEVMVWSERSTQDPQVLAELAQRYGQPVLAVHAPTLLLTDGLPGFRDDHLLPGQGNQDCAGLLRYLTRTGFAERGGQVVVEVNTRGMSEAERRQALAGALSYARRFMED